MIEKEPKSTPAQQEFDFNSDNGKNLEADKDKKESLITDEEYAKLSEKSDDYYLRGQWD